MALGPRMQKKLDEYRAQKAQQEGDNGNESREKVRVEMEQRRIKRERNRELREMLASRKNIPDGVRAYWVRNHGGFVVYSARRSELQVAIRWDEHNYDENYDPRPWWDAEVIPKGMEWFHGETLEEIFQKVEDHFRDFLKG